MLGTQSPQNRTNDTRQHYIDWLRVIAVMLLVLFHTAMIFNTADFHIKNAEQSHALGTLVNSFIYTWHMPLFMLLAGMSLWFALGKRGGRALLVERFKRIFLPLVFGVLLVIPPQTYVERLQQGRFSGSYFEFYPTFFTTGVYPQGNFTYNHLWFLAYLFVFILLTLPLLLYLRGAGSSKGRQRLADWLQSPGRLLFLLPLPVVIIHTLLVPAFPHSNNILGDWAHFVLLLYVFVLGYLLVAEARILPVVDRIWRLALVLGTALSLFFIVTELGVVQITTDSDSANQLLTALSSMLWVFTMWFWLVALLGLGRRFLNHESRFLRYASDIAYPYYILHQTVIVLLGYFVVQWDMNLWLKFGIVLVVSFVLTAALCELVKLTNLTRFIFGMKPIKTAPVTPASLKPQSGAQMS